MRLYQGDWILYERRRRSKHRKNSEERYLVGLKTQHANFRGNPLYQTTKRHFEQQSDGEQCDGERRSVQRHCGPTSFGSVKATVSNWPVSDNSWADLGGRCAVWSDTDRLWTAVQWVGSVKWFNLEDTTGGPEKVSCPESWPVTTHWHRVECCFTSTETLGLIGTGAQDGQSWPVTTHWHRVECCFTSTETLGLLGTGAQIGQSWPVTTRWVLLFVHRNPRLNRDGSPRWPVVTCHNALTPGWVLLYVHRNPRLIRDGNPGRPPRLSHSSWALIDTSKNTKATTFNCWCVMQNYSHVGDYLRALWTFITASTLQKWR